MYGCGKPSYLLRSDNLWIRHEVAKIKKYPVTRLDVMVDMARFENGQAWISSYVPMAHIGCATMILPLVEKLKMYIAAELLKAKLFTSFNFIVELLLRCDWDLV